MDARYQAFMAAHPDVAFDTRALKKEVGLFFFFSSSFFSEVCP